MNCLFHLCIFFGLLVSTSLVNGRGGVVSLLDDEDWETGTEEVLAKTPSDYLLPPTAKSKINSEGKDSASIYSKKLTTKAMKEFHHLYDSEPTPRAFDGEVLLYITPWNRRGYEVASMMAKMNKVAWLAPTWFRLKRVSESGRWDLDGEQDINTEWLQALQSNSGAECRGDGDANTDQSDDSQRSSQNQTQCTPGSDESGVIEIVPRVAFEADLTEATDVAWVIASLVSLFDKLQAHARISGFVLELPLNSITAVVSLCKQLKIQRDMKLILVLPPMQLEEAKTEAGQQGRRAVALLASEVDRISLMTYDAAHDGSPIAPYKWLLRVVQPLADIKSLREKLLLGLPFYGWRNGEDMTAEKLIVWIATDPSVRVSYNKEAQEHTWVDSSGRECSYPSPYMLQQRLKLASKLKIAGVAVWEAGQGISSFLDLF